MAACGHIDQIQVGIPDQVAGCEDCLAIGDRWVHLRICRSCGHVACCDSSPNQHATKHAHESGHPIVSSLEPGEDWSWCYQDQITLVVAPELGAP
jgi:hypothetical protein